MNEPIDGNSQKAGSPAPILPNEGSAHVAAADRAGGGLGPSRKYLFLRIEKRVLAMPLASVREVLGLGAISFVPNMPPHFAGLINLRGKIVSAIDLKKSVSFLGPGAGASASEAARRPCLIISEIKSKMFGALVDDVLEVLSIAEADVSHDADCVEGQHFFDGLIKKPDSALVPILNLERALRLGDLMGKPSRAR